MTAAEPQLQARRADLLLERVTPREPLEERLSARERLEDLLGGTLAAFLVGALSAGGTAPRRTLD
jgi:hypothetical protein